MKFLMTSLIVLAALLHAGAVFAVKEKPQKILQVKPEQSVVVTKEEESERKVEEQTEESSQDPEGETSFYGNPPGSTGGSGGGTGSLVDPDGSPYDSAENPGTVAIPAPEPDPSTLPRDPP